MVEMSMAVRITVFLLIIPAVQAANLHVQLTGEDGLPVPFAILTLPEVTSYPEEPLSRAVVDQHDRRFVPYVSAVIPGTEVFFPNSDDTRHHVYSFSDANSFELQLYRANDAAPVAFNNVGIVTLGCNIHDNMKAYVYVSDDPGVRISDLDGRVQLRWEGSELPTILEIWHPQLQSPMQVAIVPIDGDTLHIDLPFAWKDPQVGKSDLELETLLKRFSLDAD